MNTKPLTGIRVLTLEQFGAGPYGTMFLAELGAEVIKVEAPDGDPSRHVGPHKLGPNDSEYFQAWNLGKKSVTLDLKSKRGSSPSSRGWSKTADCVVNNLRGTQPAKLGIDYASLRHLKPSIVCLHISAYGRSGERAGWPGYDFLMQAEAGLMELTGEPDGRADAGRRVADRQHERPHRHRSACWPACCGPGQRDRAGDVETCLYDVAMHQLTYPGAWYLNEGDVSPRVPRSAHLSLAPVQTFPTRDGWIFIMCMTQKFWLSLVRGHRPRRPGQAIRAFIDPNSAGEEPRRADRCELDVDVPHTHHGRVAGGVQRISCRRHPSTGSTRRSTATLRAQPPWCPRCRIR